MAEGDLSNVKVLVADDEPQLRALVASCARSLGGQVIEAGDGDEAWARAEREHPDVVVLDVMMPGMSGWDVCRRIKSAATTARGGRPKVLMLTGIGEHLNEMTSPLFAADDWINKPFDVDALKERISELARAVMVEGTGPSLKKARPSTEPRLDDEPKKKKAAAKKPSSKKKAAPKKKAAAKKKAAPKKKAAAKKKAAPKKKAAAKKKKAAAKKKAAPKKKAAAKKRVAKKAAPKKKGTAKKRVAKKAAPKRQAAKKAATKKLAKGQKATRRTAKRAASKK